MAGDGTCLENRRGESLLGFDPLTFRCCKTIIYFCYRSNNMRPAMYIFLNRKLGMSTGKAGAQTAHAAVEAYRISHSQMLNAWYEGGHYCKLVMSAENADQLSIIRHYLAERGFNTKLIIDEG